jgi:hypothetical protein
LKERDFAWGILKISFEQEKQKKNCSKLENKPDELFPSMVLKIWIGDRPTII